MLGLSLGIPFRPYDRSAIQQMLDALRRNNGSLWYAPDNALGDGAPNLLSAPEFAGGLADAPTRGGLVTASTLSGYDGAIAFGHDGTTTSYAYKAFTPTVGLTYTLSVIVKMDDGNAPVFTQPANVADAGNTFALNINATATSPSTYSVASLPDGTYRVSAPWTVPGAGNHFGIVKYDTNNNRTFRVTGYKLELGSTATAYTPQSVLRQRGVYQDSTGTTPVTAVGDVIGKLNDRVGTNNATQPTTASKPLVTRVPKRLGPELIASQDLTTWTSGGAFGNWGATTSTATTITTTSINGGRYVRMPCVPGKAYTFAALVAAGTGNGAVAIAYGTSGNTLISEQTGGFVASGVARLTTVAPANAAFVEFVVRGGASGQTTTFTALSAGEVLEWTNAISFDGSNDFLQTGITTGNEGWICAGVTFGGAAGANETVFGSGAINDTDRGVWMLRSGALGENHMRISIGNGTARTTVLYTGAALRNTPRVVEGGWDTSVAMVGVDGVTTSAARTGSAGPSPASGVIANSSVNAHPLAGPMTAIIYTSVLPSAADRALIRKWIGSLQGQTL